MNATSRMPQVNIYFINSKTLVASQHIHLILFSIQFNSIETWFLGGYPALHSTHIFGMCVCVCVYVTPVSCCPGHRKNRKNTSRHFFLITVATADVVVLTLYGPVA